MRRIEPMLDDCPTEALAVLDKIDSTSLKSKQQRMYYDLLYAIALDKNHIDDGRYVQEMATVEKWYEQYGNKKNRLRARYYFGDQLRGAGQLEEAAVQFIQSEKEAVEQENWFLAGMSARSLYYIFAQTYNSPKELTCIKRAIDYFQKAGRESHEDDARIKLAIAYYDNSQLQKADSVFNISIRVAEKKNDTVCLSKALMKSVDVLLVGDSFQADTIIGRLSRAESLGLRLDYRSYANYALSYSLIGDERKSKHCLNNAYELCSNEREKAFVSSREYTIQKNSGNSSNALNVLSYLDYYTNKEVTKTLEQSVVEAYNAYLELSNNRLTQMNKIKQMLIILGVLLGLSVLIIAYLFINRESERHRIETGELRMKLERQRLSMEKSLLEADCYRLACEELESFGLEVFDKIGRVYYSAENDPVAVVKAYGSMIEKLRDEHYQNKVITSIDKTHDGVVTKLEAQIPSISRSRLVFFAYLVQGLSYTTISVIMNTNQRQNLYDIRKRLVQTIKKNAPIDEILFLNYLEGHNLEK